MCQRPRFLVLALIAALMGSSWLMADEDDEVHFCEDADGNILLQTDPCPEPVVPEVTPPPVEAVRIPASRPAAKAPVAPASTRATVSPKTRRSTSGWTLIPKTPSRARGTRSTLKHQAFPTSLAGADRPKTPSFASPESTWHTFVMAVEGNDHVGVGACLTPAALRRLGPDAESIPLEEIRSMLGRFTRIENGGDLGSFWSIYGVRADQRPKWIFFEQTDSGDWKIAGI